MDLQKVVAFHEARKKIWEEMTIAELYQVRNHRLEMQDSGLQVNQTAINQINAELRKRGEDV
jgi:hypothetical protein